MENNNKQFTPRTPDYKSYCGNCAVWVQQIDGKPELSIKVGGLNFHCKKFEKKVIEEPKELFI